LETNQSEDIEWAADGKIMLCWILGKQVVRIRRSGTGSCTMLSPSVNKVPKLWDMLLDS